MAVINCMNTCIAVRYCDHKQRRYMHVYTCMHRRCACEKHNTYSLHFQARQQSIWCNCKCAGFTVSQRITCYQLFGQSNGWNSESTWQTGNGVTHCHWTVCFYTENLLIKCFVIRSRSFFRRDDISNDIVWDSNREKRNNPSACAILCIPHL